MKKVLALLLIVYLVLFSSIGIAEDFTIHSGVMFGDTKEDVSAKETLTFKKFNEDKNIFEYGGTVAGIDNTTIYYYFDNDNKLIDVFYAFPDSRSIGINNVIAEYEQLAEALKSKYGNPIDTDSTVYELVCGKYYSIIKENDAFHIKMGHPESNANREHIAWVVPYDGYNVKIDLIIDDTDGRSQTYNCCVDYHPFTDDELAVLEEEYKKTLQQQSDDL